jgi:hypothetical protein
MQHARWHQRAAASIDPARAAADLHFELAFQREHDLMMRVIVGIRHAGIGAKIEGE